jgi:hypothetical protein
MKMIDLRWTEDTAKALAVQFGTKIALVGKLPDGGWKVFGQERLAREVSKVDLDAVPWEEKTYEVL